MQMVDVCELARFTASGKVLRLVMDIAAAHETWDRIMASIEMWRKQHDD